MKKIFTTLAMAAFAMTGFAQTAQQYFHVEFTMPIVSDGSGGVTSVASGMKDDYTYCNPEHEYLDFQAGGNLVARGSGSGDSGTAGAMGFRSTTTSPTETSAFYLHNDRTAQYNTSQGRAEIAKYPNLEQIMWTQEEPLNQGAWLYLAPHLYGMVDELATDVKVIKPSARPSAAAPATGSPKMHNAEQKALVACALNVAVDELQ